MQMIETLWNSKYLIAPNQEKKCSYYLLVTSELLSEFFNDGCQLWVDLVEILSSWAEKNGAARRINRGSSWRHDGRWLWLVVILLS